MTILHKSKKLKKELTTFNIYTMATGATVASGFFLLPGLAYAQAGPAMIFSYLISAVVIVPTIFSLCELATAMPRSGGVYFFLDRSMGPLIGTIGGIGTWLALILKTAFALVGMGVYVALFFPNIEMTPIAVGFAIFFALINLAGAKKAGILQIIFVIGLLLIIVCFSAVGFLQLEADRFSGFFDQDINRIFLAAGLVFVSYVGLTKTISISEEINNPEKTIPRGMFLAFGTVILVYLLGTIALIGLLPGESLKNNLTPVASAANILCGKTGVILMTIAAIIAFFAVANVGILSSSRYPLAMSRDHILPSFLRRLNKKNVPQCSIMMSLLFLLLVLILFDPMRIAKLAGAFQLLLFALISLAVIVMRESRIESYDPGYKSPFYPWMQIFGIIASCWLILEMGWLPLLFTVALIVFSILWYFYYARNKVIRDGAIYHIFARLGQRRFEGLDTELRNILKEKGLRDYDPFDMIITNAGYLDISDDLPFEEIVRQAASLLSKKINVKSELLVKTIMEGTQVGATPVSHGAALPHLRLPGIRSSQMVIVRSKKGVRIKIKNEFISKESTNEPIFAFFFLVSPEENPGQHLRILAQLASHVDDDRFIENWLSASNEPELKELLLREDRYLSLFLSSNLKSAALIGAEIRNLKLPESTLIAIIHRDEQVIVPSGQTILRENDRITFISNPEGIKELYAKYFG
ncbi:MAG: amino acid permease [Calditrichaceae bacterium]|nr:amino acid permease [Calditrichaceae bacterium]MBN2710302.1 amino acid permease [Calditrichaceae bacterium]RQV93005.1 MAG: amino acid permease [Calditrichota bacterium]